MIHRNTSGLFVPAAVLTTLVPAAAVILLFILDPLARARAVNFLQVWTVPLIIIIAAIAVAAVLLRNDSWVGFLIIALGIAGIVGISVHRGWQSNLAYAATVEEVSDPVPDFADRAPHQIASRQATSSLSGINGTPGRTAYMPDGDAYTTLISKPGPLNPGYTAIVSQDIALTGQADGSTCRFSEDADRRIDGLFGHSLTRAIAAKDARLIVSGGDAYGFCDGETAKVAVPVTKLEGMLVPVHVPAGVALYDGKTGEVEIVDGKEADGLPGGAIGLSYSERVNESMKTWNGTWWSTLIGQTGLTDKPKDEDDPNSLNASNFALLSGKDTSYVSPLTSVASSVTIDAVLVMDSSGVEAGSAPKVTMHKLATPRASNAATADRVKADFSDLAWSSGIFIQEIVPAADGEWAASIGLNQNITHRVLIKDDGSSCLQDAYGNVLRCSGDPKAQAVPGSSEAPASVPDDISAMSDAELEQLLKAVTEEVFNRIGETPAK